MHTRFSCDTLCPLCLHARAIALYCHASASPFGVCSYPGVTSYACYACTQEQFVPYCCSSASPFEVCPETAVHNSITVVVAHIPDFAAYIYHCWWVRLDCCFCFVWHSENLKHSPRKIRDVSSGSLFRFM